MSALFNYLVLPREVSPTELAHVKKINWVAIIAFYLHIPLFMGVAWMCDTGPLFALGLSLLVLVGPTLAYLYLEGQRTIAQINGFSAMCMGGLLVHFGQGPMQIEMHFYFFVLLALLATYGNPMVNVTAAVTAAVHHFTLWLLLPASIFNYDASIWVVVVHAIFVVVETVAAVFIARSFYDNVIGLEKIVEARTREVREANAAMRVVLDHVSQGLMTMDLSGGCSPQRSAMLDTLMGPMPASKSWADWVASADPTAGTWTQLGLDELAEDILPTEVVLGQMPSRISTERDGEKQTFSVDYQPIQAADGQLGKLLVVVTDITEKLRQAEAEAQQRENLRLFELIASDASGFKEFFKEASRLMKLVRSPDALGLVELKRVIHTLKGNTAIFGLARFSGTCHELEDQIEVTGERPTATDLQGLDEAWGSIEAKVAQLSGGDAETRLSVPREDLEALEAAIEAKEPHEVLAKKLRHAQLEPTEKRLAALAEQARKIAERLGRSNVEVQTDVRGDPRVEGERWSSFWSSLVHVLRNAVDHGMETAEERANAGKSEQATLQLSSYEDEGRLFLDVRDDGRGIDVGRLAEKAKERGFDYASTIDLLHSIFDDGVSTRTEVSETSGRGVGMAAVKAEVEALGGSIEVSSERGAGTRFSFVFPLDTVDMGTSGTPGEPAAP